MSEKFQERVPQRPSENPSTAALTPAERADRELAKIDEEMDAIMDTRSPNERAALYNPPSQALQPPEGRSMTPGVAPPIAASSFTHMVLNCAVPGLGSLLHGKTGVGAAQLGMAVAVVPMLFVKIWLALLLAVVAYVWSVSTGVGFLSTPTERSWK